MSTISKNYRKPNTLTASRFSQSAAAPILLGVLFFFVLCLGAPDSIKGMAMIVAIAALFVTAVRFGVLRERIRWPFVALTLYVLMDGISTFYAVSGKFALKEFLKVFMAYGMAVILLATSPKDEKVTGKRIATILAVCTGVAGLVGIDMYSTGWISGAVLWVLKLFTDAYEGVAGVQTLARMASIFTNANVYAGVSGLGLLLGLGLADTTEIRKERCLYLVILYLNAVTFVLTVSLGAFFFAFAAVLVFVLLSKREDHCRTWTLLFETAIITAVSALLALKIHARIAWMKPLYIVVVGAAALCLIDYLIEKHSPRKSSGNGRFALIISIGCVVLAVGYAIAALTVIGDLKVDASLQSVSMLAPKAGEYRLALEKEGDSVAVTITSQSFEQIAIWDATTLYSGDAKDAAFSIPKGSIAVHFSFNSEGEAQIKSATFGRYRIPLRYLLLPSAVAGRMGPTLFIDVIQRLVYFQDGFKLFRRSPVIGLGMGAFENAIKSEQSYYYETKYAHNHYFQTMLETGIIGLLLFLALLVSSVIAVWKSRKKHPYAPMLGAALVFMAGQAVHDIVFSAYAYLPIAYGTFAMINLCCGEEVTKPKLTQTIKTIGIAVTAVCAIIYCGFLAGNLIAAKKIQDNPTMDALVECSRLDRFEWADYALPYVISATGGKEIPSNTRSQADAFARRLENVNSNTIPIYLAEYYFASERLEQGFAMMEKYVDYVSSDQNAWNTAFSVLQAYADDSEVFRSEVARIAQKLEKWNAENIGHIELDNNAKAFLAEYIGQS